MRKRRCRKKEREKRDKKEEEKEGFLAVREGEKKRKRWNRRLDCGGLRIVRPMERL